jgi:rare lipoprotein A
MYASHSRFSIVARVERFHRTLALAAAAFLLHGCGTFMPQSEESVVAPAEPREPPPPPPSLKPRPSPPRAKPALARPGKYFQNDGPGTVPPEALLSIPEPTPRDEPLAAFANRPYVVFKRAYAPTNERTPWRERGMASWYGRKFHGRLTATGEKYDMYSLTAAHRTLPLPSYVRVTNLANRRSIVVRVNDRGPFLRNRIIDVSYAAAAQLGFAGTGRALVEIEAILAPSRIAVGELREPSQPLVASKGCSLGCGARERVATQQGRVNPRTSS